MLNNSYLNFKTILPLLLLSFCCLLTGCARFQQVNFDVKIPGSGTGVFIVKNSSGQLAYSANIKGGQLKLDKQFIEQTGFYTISVADDAIKNIPVPYEVYLEPGNYKIEFSAAINRQYPKITSTSRVQQELSAFYAIAAALHNDPKASLKAFINQYPRSAIATHLMAGFEYENAPADYYQIFKSLSPEARNSEEGREIGEKLSKLVKLLPGEVAPLIAGTTPDGKTFKIADLNKKIYLVEFWKAANELSRTNHSAMDVTNMMSTVDRKKDVGIISISLDEKRDWWTSAIKDDQMNWPQYSDLKGNESVNALNWAITRIPTYYLVDGKWRIVERDIPRAEIPVVINEYFRHLK